MHALQSAHLAFRPLRRVKVGGATAGVRMPLHKGDHGGRSWLLDLGLVSQQGSYAAELQRIRQFSASACSKHTHARPT